MFSLHYIYLMFTIIFNLNTPAAYPSNCPAGSNTNTAWCSFAGYRIPGFPTRNTWRRTEETPNIFYGRAVHYSEGLMWSTALQRGFDKEYLVQFDCLVSGFFINDVGRVAWMLHEGEAYRCLVVDNARSRDLYETVILNREAVEVEYIFARDVLGNTIPENPDPIVLMAYQVEEPTPLDWYTTQRLDEYLYAKWVTSHDKEPKGWIQIKPDQQAWYKIGGWYELWTRIPGCLYCDDEYIYEFAEEVTYYEVVAGDSLDRISKKVYGYSHPRFWDAIYEANKNQMTNPYYIEIGQILRIPVYNKTEIEVIELEQPYPQKDIKYLLK